MIKLLIDIFNQIGRDNKNFLRGLTISFLIRVLGVGSQLALNMFIGRLMGPAGAGIFFLALTIANIASKIGRLGMDNTVLRLGAERRESRDASGTGVVFRTGFLIVLVSSILVASFLFLLSKPLSNIVFGKPELNETLRAIALFVCPYSILWFLSFCLQSGQRIFASQFLQVACIQTIGLCIILVFNKMGILNPGNLAWGYTIAASIGLFAAWCLFSVMAHQEKLPILQPQFAFGDMFSLGLSLYVPSLMYVFSLWMPVLILGMVSSNEEVGGYQIASRCAQLTLFFFMAVNTIAAPKFAALKQRGKILELERFLQLSTLISVLASTPIVAVLLFKPQFIIGFFGTKFMIYSNVLVCLTLGQFFYICMGSISHLLMMTGYEKVYQKIVLISAGVQLIVCITLAPSLGAMGAAISTSVSMVMTHFFGLIVVWKEIKISPFLPIKRAK